MWQFLRTVCLILQGFNPLAWRAYYASRQDGELACDARVIKNYSDEEKFYYAESILRVLKENKRNKREILMVTSMGENKKRIKERIEAVMEREKKPACVIAIVLAVIVGVICFLGMGRLGLIEKSFANDTVPEQGTEALLRGLSVPYDSSVWESEKRIHKVDIKEQYTTDIAVASNYYHIDEYHVLWGCGQNHYGQLGQGTQDYYFHGEMVKIAENVVHVDYSQSGFAIFLTEDGSVWTWGYNLTGCCGVKDVRMVSQPVKVAENVQMVWTESTDKIVLTIEKDEDFEGIPSRYYRNTVLLKDNGTYWCCGAGYNEVHHVSHYYEAIGRLEEIYGPEFYVGRNEENIIIKGSFPGCFIVWQ